MGKMSKDEAEVLLENWADFMELDTDRQLYTDIVEELRLPVKLEKLSFDEGTETFKLMLRNPIKGKDSEIGFVEIKSCDFNAKRILQKFKDNESIDSARAMLSAYTNLNEAEVKQLKDLDISRINSIILGFITQTEPQKKG